MSLKTRRNWSIRLDLLVKIATILSLIAVPLLVAWGGWRIQHTISTQSVNKDYVQLAVSILTKSDEDVDPSIRTWAADLLSKNSPVALDDDVRQKLSTGEVKLPLFARGGVLFEDKFIEELFSEWNQSTELSPEFKAILIELADDLIKHRWQKVATFFEPSYYNEQVSFLSSGMSDRRKILDVMRQFVHEAMGIGASNLPDIYSVDLNRVVKVKYLDIVDDPHSSEQKIIKFRLIQDDGKEVTGGYLFMKDSYYFRGGVG